MKQLVILSGKGGTGKTTVAAALAHLAARETSLVLADADVDAANLELVLAPTRLEEHDFVGGKVAVIDPELCTGCGLCAEVCRFEAISETWRHEDRETGRPSPPLPISPSPCLRVDPIACEGCAVCYYQCPAQAIRLEEPVAGRWFRSQTRFGPLFHAQLFAGQENSGKLVTLVKQQARLLALDTGADLLVDGPPGIGCPVIASLAGADLALIVTEPTVAGAHDLERILGVAAHFRVPTLLCINKYDLSPARTREIEVFATRQGIEIIGHIPFDPVVTQAMVQGLPVTVYTAGPVAEELRQMWAQLSSMLC
jgi:MinD superfamily P-loop ATPase